MLADDHLLRILWRRRATFLTIFAVVLGGVALVTFALPKVYSSEAHVLVDSVRRAQTDFESTQTNQVLARTFAELLKTRGFAGDVADKLAFDISTGELRSSVDVETVPDSQLIRITADASTPQRAREIADAYAVVFQERAAELASQGGHSAEVTIAEPAPLVLSPSRPQPVLYLAIGTLLALFAAAGGAVLRHRLDQSLEFNAATTEILGLPVISRIPERRTTLLKLLSEPEPDHAGADRIAEASRLLLANLAFVNGGRRPDTLAVVSPGEGEGKSTCCLSVALAAGELGIEVALVDADLRRPAISLVLEDETSASKVPGLSKFLLDPELSLGEIAIDVPKHNIALVPAGAPPPNPAALLGSGAVTDFEQRVRRVFELVIYDTPPLSVGVDATLVAAAADAVVLVIDPERSKRTNVLYAVDQLRRANARVLGVVVNRVRDTTPEHYYYQPPPAGDRPDRERQVIKLPKRARDKVVEGVRGGPEARRARSRIPGDRERDREPHGE